MTYYIWRREGDGYIDYSEFDPNERKLASKTVFTILHKAGSRREASLLVHDERAAAAGNVVTAEIDTSERGTPGFDPDYSFYHGGPGTP